MKLLNYTSAYFAAILLVLISIWAVIFYFEMLDEIYDSLDDGLENRKALIIQKAQEEPTILAQSKYGEGSYMIEEINAVEASQFRDIYRDTLMYMQNEKDDEPVRLLETAFRQNGSYYKLALYTSMVEEDDLVRNLLYLLLFLYLGLMGSIIIINNLVLRKIWKPFYRLLTQLKNFSIEKNEKVNFEKTNIEEFTLLNESMEKMLRKSQASYKNQKQFIENAAHELQTPLAISINKLELFIEKNDFDNVQIETIASVLDNLERLTRFNKSLLLLSKIENKQYTDKDSIPINALIKGIISDFKDLAAHHSISFELQEIDFLNFEMNKSLAIILFTNLIKNALLHGSKDSTIEIVIEKNTVSVKNIGEEKALEENKLFHRFHKQSVNQNSTGLGLAICKAITDKYGLELAYRFTGKHEFEVVF